MPERTLIISILCATIATTTVSEVKADDGEIDPRNANYSYTAYVGRFVDSIPLNITYNSRSSINTVFGLGWCSDIGTTIAPTARGLVVTICGAGDKVTFTSPTHEAKYRAFLEKHDEEFRKQILGYDDSNSEKSDLIASYLAANPKYQWLVDFDIDSYTAEPTTTLKRVGSGVVAQIDALTYGFDRFGRLIRIRDLHFDGDVSTFYFENHLIGIRLGGNDSLVKVKQNEMGHVTNLFINKKSLTLSYLSNSSAAGTETLSQIKGDKALFTFEYSGLYYLTRWTDASGSVEEITYDEKKNWALSRTVNNECSYAFSYNFDPADPNNHYFSDVIEKCKGASARSYHYEFYFASPKSLAQDLDRTTARIGDRAISYDSGTGLFQQYSDGDDSERRVLVPVEGRFIALSRKGMIENVVDARCQAVVRRTSSDFLSVQFSNDCKPLRIRWRGHGNFQFVYDDERALSEIVDVKQQQNYRIIRDSNHQITGIEKVGFWVKPLGAQSPGASIRAPADADLRRLADVLMKVKLNAIAKTISPELNDPFAAWCQCTLPLFPPQLLH